MACNLMLHEHQPILVVTCDEMSITVTEPMIRNMLSVVALLPTLPVVRDPIDGRDKQRLDLGGLRITCDEFLAAMVIASGGSVATSVCDMATLNKLGISSDVMRKMFDEACRVSAPVMLESDKLDVMGDGASIPVSWDGGAASRNVYPDPMSNTCCKGPVHYVAARTRLNIGAGTCMPGGSLTFFPMKAWCHGIQHIAAKITFPPGSRPCKDVLDYVFGSVDLGVKGAHVTVPMCVNNAMAKQRGMWPYFFNTPPADPNASWTATIPLMFSYGAGDASLLRSADMRERDVVVSLNDLDVMRCVNGVVRVELVAEYVYFYAGSYPVGPKFAVDGDAEIVRHARECVSCAENHPTSVAPTKVEVVNSVASEDKKMLDIISKVKSIKMDQVCGGPNVEVLGMCRIGCQVPRVTAMIPWRGGSDQRLRCKNVRLNFQDVQIVDIGDLTHGSLEACTGLMLILQHTHIDKIDNPFPIRCASIRLNGVSVFHNDCCDLHEWNWLRVGQNVPKDMSRCLIPFSHRFGDDDPAHMSSIAFSGFKDASLVLRPNMDMRMFRWNLCIVAFTSTLK